MHEKISLPAESNHTHTPIIGLDLLPTLTNSTDLSFEEFYSRIGGDPTFLILGSQGSGTNLLRRILTSALGFSVTTDRSLIFNAAANLCRERTVARAKCESHRVVKSLFPNALRKRLLPRRFYRQNQNWIGVEGHLRHSYTESPSEFANFFYSYHAFVTKGLHKALKSDDIWENLHLVREIIPNYRICLLIRDPRDNAISIMNKNFGPCEIYHASLFVRHRMDAYIALADSDPERAITLKYEDLLCDPIGSVKRMENFVGATITPDVERKIDELDVKRDNHQKWRKLDNDSLAASEFVFGDLLDRFNYERGSAVPWSATKVDQIRCTLKDVFRRIPQKIQNKTARYVRG